MSSQGGPLVIVMFRIKALMQSMYHNLEKVDIVPLPRGCNLAAVGGLVSLDDPESYAGWRLVSW